MTTREEAWKVVRDFEDAVENWCEALGMTQARLVEAKREAVLALMTGPASKPGGYELLQKIASGAALTVAEFRDLGERLGLAPEQIGAAALSFASIPSASARAERERIETAVDVLIGSAHVVGLHTDGPNGAPRADLDDMKRRKRDLMELIDAWLTKGNR